jgi:hypothetical protein
MGVRLASFSLREQLTLGVDINPAIGCLHCVELGSIADFSKVNFVSVFRVFDSSMKHCLLAHDVNTQEQDQHKKRTTVDA